MFVYQVVNLHQLRNIQEKNGKPYHDPGYPALDIVQHTDYENQGEDEYDRSKN